MESTPSPEVPFAAPSRRSLLAYAGPFGLFVLLQALPALVHKLAGGAAAATSPLWMTAPELWVYPLQTVLCAGLLWFFRGEYPSFRMRSSLAIFGAVAGLVVFALWVAPQTVFHSAPRIEGGFDPTRLLGNVSEDGAALYRGTVTLRFLRLVVVVPFLEELFWRGFLLRYLVREDFLAVPFGTYTSLSFFGVTLGFMLEHSTPDYPAALLAGALYNLVAIRTKSLSACVLAHGVTNALLGVYVMQTQQWGFW